MVLNSLSFIAKDQPWPPASEKERLQEYEDNEALREGEVNDIWPGLYKYLRDGTTAEQDFFIGFPWIVTKKAIDTIMGEAPTFAIQDNDTATTSLNDFLKQLNYFQILREQIADIDAFGDSVQKIYIDENNQVQIQSIEPEHWFPVFRRGTRTIEYHVLAFCFENVDAAGKEKHYIKFEIHSTDQIEHRLYELNKSGIGGVSSSIGDQVDLVLFYPGLQEIEQNPLNQFLIITAHNQMLSGDTFGNSSYTPDFKAILKKLIIRYSLANNILDVFSRPTVVGPRDMQTYDPVTGKNIFRPGEYKGLDIDPGVAPFVPQAITWDGHLIESDTWTKNLEEKLYIVAELPKAAVSMDSSGVAASGVAWKLAMTPLLSKCARIRVELDQCAKSALNIAGLLSSPSQDFSNISIGWQDGLPNLAIEEATQFYQLANTPAFMGETGLIWLLKNKLGVSLEDAQAIASDPSRGGGLGVKI